MKTKRPCNLCLYLIFMITPILLSRCKVASNDSKKPKVIIQVENPIAIARTHETIALSSKFIKKQFPHHTIENLQIIDNKLNQLLLSQAIDYNSDGVIDDYLFQTDLNPKEIKYFSISTTTNKPDSTSVFSKFISKPEGLGDFSWENDYIGYRMYGQPRADAQGTGTAIDVWCKSTARRLTDEWYTSGQSYHIDKGYGADHYASGKNQGCGGSGVYYNDTVYYSKPYTTWRIIANGPIRLVFELEFTGWKIGQTDLKETKRITLDAGQYFNHIESTYTSSTNKFDFLHAVGIAQRQDSQSFINKNEGTFESWEQLTVPKDRDNGALGTGFIADPKSSIYDIKNIQDHLFGLMELKPNKSATYYTGAVWSKFGAIKSPEDWKKYVGNKALCIQNKCVVTLMK